MVSKNRIQKEKKSFGGKSVTDPAEKEAVRLNADCSSCHPSCGMTNRMLAHNKRAHQDLRFPDAYAEGSTLYCSLKYLAKYFGLLNPTL